MTTDQYLKDILASQALADDSKEMKELRQHRVDVENLLRTEFQACSPTIRYGGSKAKGTMIRDAYDLDIICYFPCDDSEAGDSLEDIYNKVRKALDKAYYVDPKTSALRLKSKDPQALVRDFHIDVVPGRYVDGDDGDCFLFQSNAEKKRLKTNIDTHINHVKNSGVTDAIRLLKLWRSRKDIPIKQFVWELLVIKLLRGKSHKSLADQLTHVWSEVRDSKEPILVEDPANPSGNDLSKILNTGIWQVLSGAADSTLRTIANVGWEGVFGTPKHMEGEQKITALKQAVAAAAVHTKPWSDRRA